MNAYRDDHDAAIARINALEHELAAKDTELDELRTRDSATNRFYDSFYEEQLRQVEADNERLKAENRKLHERIILLEQKFPREELEAIAAGAVKELQRRMGDVIVARAKYIVTVVLLIVVWALIRLIFWTP